MTLRFLLLLTAFLLLSAAPVDGHGQHVNGTIIMGPCIEPGFDLTGAIIPHSGIGCYVVPGVTSGASFQITADNGEEPFVVGFGDECPGPDWRGPMTDALLAGDVEGAAEHAQNAWLMCGGFPDFDVKFTGGEYANGPGDEAGTVPGPGDAVIFLSAGRAAEPFTWHEY